MMRLLSVWVGVGLNAGFTQPSYFGGWVDELMRLCL